MFNFSWYHNDTCTSIYHNCNSVTVFQSETLHLLRIKQILHGTYLKQGRSKTNLLLSSSSWNAKSHLQEKWTHKFFKKETLHAINSGGGSVKSLVLAQGGIPYEKVYRYFKIDLMRMTCQRNYGGDVKGTMN